MRKQVILLFVFSLISLPNLKTYAAIPAAGVTCTKVGSVQIYKSKKYTCIRLKGKIVWDKGVKVITPLPLPIPTPTPTPVPTLTPTPTPTITLTPTSTPTPTPTPTTSLHQGLAEKVSIDAFDSILDFQNRQYEIPPGFVFIEQSPHSNRQLAESTLQDLQLGAKFWQNFTSSATKIHIVFADRSDLDWFRDKMSEIQPQNTSWLNRIYNLAKANPLNQYGGSNGYDLQGNSLFFFLPGTSTTASSPGWLGVGPHEWTHSAQWSIAKNFNNLPCWLKEGQATFYGNVLSNSKRDNWANVWKYQLNTLKDDYSQFYTMNAGDLQKWFDNHSYDMPENVCGPDGSYQIGAIATEYLVGTLGVHQMNALLQNLDIRGKWETNLSRLSGKPVSQVMLEVINHILVVRDWLKS